MSRRQPAFIRPATLQDVHRLASRLRVADRREIAASSGASPLKALLAGARSSDVFDAWVIDGRVIALSGARGTAPGVAGVWLVGGDAIFGSAKWAFARLSRPYCDRINRRWPVLSGRVQAANAAHVRWLAWCGFDLSEPEPFGALGDLFHPFSRTARPCATP